MKKIFVSAICLFLSACSNEQICYRENCFITETQMSTDMQKIHDILLEYYRITLNERSEFSLKFAKVTCDLFGKDNKKLNKEIDKIKKVYGSEKKNKENKKLSDELKKSLKGLKLDFKQVILLVKELEKSCREIEQKNRELLAPYKSRAIEIVKSIDKENEQKDEWSWGHYENELRWEARIDIYYRMKHIASDNYNKFSTYNLLIGGLGSFIDEEILTDSFLKQHHSVLSAKDEPRSGLYLSVYSLVPRNTKSGEIIFDAARKAALNDSMKKEELSGLLDEISSYMRGIISNVALIQNDVTNKLDDNTLWDLRKEKEFDNFFNSSRYAITNLTDRYAKSDDFEREIEKLADRLAYKTYYEVNIARFLYTEWRNVYYSQIEELFVNANKLTSRLYDLIKDEKISDDTPNKRRYEHKNNMINISNIKEIVKIGVKKILSAPDCYIDSIPEIKESFKRRFIKTRELYLKNLGTN